MDHGGRLALEMYSKGVLARVGERRKKVKPVAVLSLLESPSFLSFCFITWLLGVGLLDIPFPWLLSADIKSSLLRTQGKWNFGQGQESKLFHLMPRVCRTIWG